MKRLIKIPFDGFYCSYHSDNIDSVIENELETTEQREQVEYMPIYQEYAQDYLDTFADIMGLKTLSFDELWSPDYYNYETDEIIANIDLKEVTELFNNVDKGCLTKVAHNRHTSYDGFISFYNNDWQTWGSVKDWDMNQLETLLLAVIDQRFDNGEEDLRELILEDMEVYCIVLNHISHLINEE